MNNPIPYIQQYMSVVNSSQLRSYQKDWLSSSLANKNTAVLGARQIGKSTFIALAAITWGCGYVWEGVNYHASDTFIASKDLKTAKNIIAMVNKHLETIETLYGIRIRNSKLGGVNEVYLWNGRRIVSMPGTPNSLQGFTGNVIIDELSANNADPQEILAQAMSISSSNSKFKVVVCSNADIEGSFVHDFFYGDSQEATNRRSMWSCYNTNIYEAYDMTLPFHIQDIKDTISSNLWKRFYENEFLGSGSGLLTLPYLTSFVDTSYKAPARSVRPYVIMGVDPGFSDNGNPTGIVVASINEGHVTVIHEELMFSPTVESLIDNLSNLRTLHGVNKTYIDQGSVGYHVVVKAKQLWGATVEGVSCSDKGQVTWFNMLVNLLQDKKVTFTNNKFLIQDLSCISLSGTKLIVPERPLSIYKTVEPYMIPTTGKYKIHADAGMAFLILMDEIVRTLTQTGNRTKVTSYGPKASSIYR
jgi:hypothetical protein